MPIPDYETLMLPVLRAFAGGAPNVSAILATLRTEFDITDEEASEMLPSGRVTVLSSRAHWARTYLSKAGLLESPRRNQHVVTAQGKALLSQNPSRIDNETLSKFAGFDEWRAKSAERDNSETKFVEPASRTETPDEQIDRAFREIETALSSEILGLVQTMNPIRFEKLILDLLTKMGYGAGNLASRQLTRASGDGGIDGIIYEDALGLDAVYIQAKRYGPDNKVSRPAIQQFVGSLTGEGATKGVFVTTSEFTKEARDFVSRVSQRIVLIDGQALTRFMIQHEVGARARETYVLRTVDEDYFSDVN